MHLSWRDVNAFVFDAAKKEHKQVLFNASGDARPGELLAVMGPSGAGKTTLLNLLADRAALGTNGKWDGDIRINGCPLPPLWKRQAAYSMQKDIFFAKLTVHDHLRCTAALRLPASWTSQAKEEEMMRIVRLLRLEKALHTPVGTPTERGLSGGELKRLNIATELLSRPGLLFMDECADTTPSNPTLPRPTTARAHGDVQAQRALLVQSYSVYWIVSLARTGPLPASTPALR